MRKKFWISLALLLVVPGLLFTFSCAKKTVKSEASVSEMAKEEQAASEKTRAEELERQQKEAERQQEMERLRKLEEERLRDQRLREAQQEEARRRAAMVQSQRKMFLEELILFDFDRSVLTPVAQGRLKTKAAWMRENPNLSVIIEGHCDERGTNAYNLALGERRAEAAKSFLIDLGISASRMATISYGEERPFDKGHNEDAWALNRRAHFVIE